MKYKLVSNYKENDNYRYSFHLLTERIFGFQLEDWYQKGFWQEKYIPYSLFDDDRIISNVSVNLMDFVVDGLKKRYIQLGTVMTEESYRNQGLGRYLMEQVLKKYEETADGIYLFANDSAVDFYPKFGFTKCREYQYSKKIKNVDDCVNIRRIDRKDNDTRAKILNVIPNMAENSHLQMDNDGLYLFYIDGIMADQMYYCEQEDAYLAAEVNRDILYLHQIISKRRVNLDHIIASFGNTIKEVVLGFVPLDTTGYDVQELNEDNTLFILGDDLRRIKEQKLRFPEMSHA